MSSKRDATSSFDKPLQPLTSASVAHSQSTMLLLAPQEESHGQVAYDQNSLLAIL